MRRRPAQMTVTRFGAGRCGDSQTTATTQRVSKRVAGLWCCLAAVYVLGALSDPPDNHVDPASPGVFFVSTSRRGHVARPDWLQPDARAYVTSQQPNGIRLFQVLLFATAQSLPTTGGGGGNNNISSASNDEDFVEMNSTTFTQSFSLSDTTYVTPKYFALSNFYHWQSAGIVFGTSLLTAMFTMPRTISVVSPGSVPGVFQLPSDGDDDRRRVHRWQHGSFLSPAFHPSVASAGATAVGVLLAKADRIHAAAALPEIVLPKTTRPTQIAEGSLVSPLAPLLASRGVEQMRLHLLCQYQLVNYAATRELVTIAWFVRPVPWDLFGFHPKRAEFTGDTEERQYYEENDPASPFRSAAVINVGLFVASLMASLIVLTVGYLAGGSGELHPPPRVSEAGIDDLSDAEQGHEEPVLRVPGYPSANVARDVLHPADATYFGVSQKSSAAEGRSASGHLSSQSVGGNAVVINLNEPVPSKAQRADEFRPHHRFRTYLSSKGFPANAFLTVVPVTVLPAIGNAAAIFSIAQSNPDARLSHKAADALAILFVFTAVLVVFGYSWYSSSPTQFKKGRLEPEGTKQPRLVIRKHLTTLRPPSQSVIAAPIRHDRKRPLFHSTEEPWLGGGRRLRYGMVAPLEAGTEGGGDDGSAAAPSSRPSSRSTTEWRRLDFVPMSVRLLGHVRWTPIGRRSRTVFGHFAAMISGLKGEATSEVRHDGRRDHEDHDDAHNDGDEDDAEQELSHLPAAARQDDLGALSSRTLASAVNRVSQRYYLLEFAFAGVTAAASGVAQSTPMRRCGLALATAAVVSWSALLLSVIVRPHLSPLLNALAGMVQLSLAVAATVALHPKVSVDGRMWVASWLDLVGGGYASCGFMVLEIQWLQALS